MNTISGRSIAILTLSMAFAAVLFSQDRPFFSIADLLRAHGVWRVTPLSIQITGASTQDGVTLPVQITATNRDEAVFQYANQRKYVATPTAHFVADGSRMTYEPAPGGFAQLDVTSVFALTQLSRRPITAGKPERLGEGQSLRVRLRGQRSEWHFRRFEVADQLDLYVGSSGLLEGISRTFYENEPRWERTVAVRFDDYRETQGVLLPYHIERYLDGKLTETIAIDTYTFDVPAGAELFARGRVR
jgi:hypothetical protein